MSGLLDQGPGAMSAENWRTRVLWATILCTLISNQVELSSSSALLVDGLMGREVDSTCCCGGSEQLSRCLRDKAEMDTGQDLLEVPSSPL